MKLLIFKRKPLSDEEFTKRVELFEAEINRKAVRLQRLSVTITFFPFHDGDKRYDYNKGGFIQLKVIGSKLRH